MEYKEINDNELLYLIADNNDDYKKILFEKYKPIVLAIAKKYNAINIDASVDFDDLVQIGYIGLNNAIRFYKDDNCLFYTFACFCIDHALSKEVYKKIYRKGRCNCTFISYEEDQLNAIIRLEEEKDHLHFSEVFLKLKNFLDFFDALVFELRLNGFKYKEIASLLDVGESKVDYSIQKTRRKLKKSL